MKYTESKKIIAVIGSTGLQGGGLVRALLKDQDETFQVRALTRNPDKDSAKALAKAGAEVVAFDMDGSAEDMAVSLQGVYGLFVVTNYWEHFDQEREAEQAKAVIAAGEMAGVQHYVWSTLEDTTPFFDSLPESQRPAKVNGNYVPFFDIKGQTNPLFPQDKTTILYTSAYLEDLYNYGWISNGVWKANLDPTTTMPVIAVEDIGKSAYAIFKAGNKYVGETLYIATDRLTGKELMNLATKAIGEEPCSFETITHKEFTADGSMGAKLIGNMFEFMRLNEQYIANLDPATAHELLGDNLITAKAWFEDHKTEIGALGAKTASADPQ